MQRSLRRKLLQKSPSRKHRGHCRTFIRAFPPLFIPLGTQVECPEMDFCSRFGPWILACRSKLGICLLKLEYPSKLGGFGMAAPEAPAVPLARQAREGEKCFKKVKKSMRLRSFFWRGSRLLPNASGSGLISAETFLGRVGRKCCSCRPRADPKILKMASKTAPNSLKKPKHPHKKPKILLLRNPQVRSKLSIGGEKQN